MRRNLICSLGLSISVFVGGLGLASFASAQSTTAPPASTPAKHAALETLRQAHRLLVHADHDYDGRRARAAEEVHKAIKDLEGKHAPKNVQPGSAPAVASQPAKVKQPKMHESQGNSDAQMRQALQLLQTALPQISSKHPHATARVTAAIHEINVALKIK